jgi:ubiquinone/menaquinone biosynthesis C-methylase UbiE
MQPRLSKLGSRPQEEQRLVGPTVSDYVSLFLTILAKLNRRHLSSRHGEISRNFYEQFFVEKDYQGWNLDERRNVRRATISKYLNQHISQGASLLDIGCGFGEVLSCLPKTYRLYGMDYSYSNVLVAQRILKDTAEVKQGSIYEIPYETASEDICLCLEVLEHIDDDGRALREIVRVLKPGGILITSVPYTYYWPQYEKLIGHFRHYTRRSFEDILRGAGLTIKDYLPNYPNWHASYARRYVWVRFLSITLGSLMNLRDVFQFKWPWDKGTLMSKAKKSLAPLLEKDETIDYSGSDTSTFIVAGKPETTADSATHC